ncbi:NADH-quinone oxidoreductase subunit C [bacterium]|nr:NADH-quinone oxidoreductase subunit C [bacterium]
MSLQTDHETSTGAPAQKLERGLGPRLLRLEQPHPNRIYLTVAPGDHVAAAVFLFDELSARLATASAVDHRDHLEINYHFALDGDRCVVTVKTFAPKPEPHLESLARMIAGAEWIEREIADLFGCRFDGHPRPERLILADDWPADRHPLRRGGPS